MAHRDGSRWQIRIGFVKPQLDRIAPSVPFVRDIHVLNGGKVLIEARQKREPVIGLVAEDELSSQEKGIETGRFLCGGRVKIGDGGQPIGLWIDGPACAPMESARGSKAGS